ncbi:hypothetical protein Pmani_009242 [Petrolisthes manimaculis]|uniref:OSCP1 n=1 Tax=Petrolisthes manimaculis TaxID=1843537 RepID=A0AAE1Q5C7_9EUCA|nr:hypothetical protein Pmani_009242 [Petrolisthes manimaculis]
MSLRALPLQFLNLGGEMMYIIDQRLRAQNIHPGRAAKVRNDIMAIMLNRRFVEELFKPQELYSSRALRTVFDKLAHASIMRLNAPSMDKLYDLMVMGLKQQMLACPTPTDLLMVTLNHLDAMVAYATSPPVLVQVNATLSLFRETYEGMSEGELSEARATLLMFVQDLRIRVSIFLKHHLQTHTGTFSIPIVGPVPQGCEVPGVIRIFEDNGEVSGVVRFPVGGQYFPPGPPGSLAPDGQRNTTLGTNMYENQNDDAAQLSNQTSTSDICSLPSHFPGTDVITDSGPMKGRGQEELNLLAQLIGSLSTTKKEFRLNLFPADDDTGWENRDDDAVSGSHPNTITIDGGQRGGRPELGVIFGELTLGGEQEEVHGGEDKGQDLLDLMDSA